MDSKIEKYSYRLLKDSLNGGQVIHMHGFTDIPDSHFQFADFE